jgi:DNA-binding transcriptional MocR family regulator
MRNGKTDHLYLQVAHRIEGMIEQEVLRIGDRLPSVRILSEEQGISLSTAFQAYYHLENKGLIEPRPKSGYYVRFSPKKFPELPTCCEPVKKVSTASVGEIITEVFRDFDRQSQLNFAVGSPPIELLPSARLNKSLIQVMRTMPDSGLDYEKVQGNETLRNQIARLSLLWDGQFNSDDVITTTGCMDAITLSLSAVTKPGDTIAVESPSYHGILQLAESFSLKVLELPTNPVYGIEMDYLNKALRQHKIKAFVLIPNFNNPLGGLMPDENKKELVQWLTAANIPLIEDDIYGDLHFGRSRPRTCKSFDTEGMVWYCSSFSKSLAPGYRVGWIIPGRQKEKILQLKLNHTISSASLPQAAIGHFLENGRYEHHLRHLRKKLHTQCLRYIQAIKEYFPEGTRVSRPQGGFVLWLELDRQVNTVDLFQKALKHHINIAPGRMYTLQDRYHNCLRLTFAQPWSDKVEKGIKKLGELVKGMK